MSRGDTTTAAARGSGVRGNTVAEPVLSVSGLVSGYGRVRVLEGVDLEVARGEVVTLIGANGAGKSTLLKSIAGLVPAWEGSVRFLGEEVSRLAPERIVRRGLALVPEGRMLFGAMTVEENLSIGAYARRGPDSSSEYAEDEEAVYELFPPLRERSRQLAATLSGGEQQMLAIGRALTSRPRLLLLDEPSLGLAPRVIAEIFAALEALRARGVTLLLVEQDARLALKHADRGYVMRTGSVAMTGRAGELLADDDVRRIYLGAWHGEE